MQKLRKGAYFDAAEDDRRLQQVFHESEHGFLFLEQLMRFRPHRAYFTRDRVPQFPFELSVEHEEIMLSAFLWKHGLPSIWFGEGCHFEEVQRRFKYLKFRSEANRSSNKLAKDYEYARQCLLGLLHHRVRDVSWQRQGQRAAEQWRCWPPASEAFALQRLVEERWATATAAPAEAIALAKPLETVRMLGAGLAYPREVACPPCSLATSGVHAFCNVDDSRSSKCLQRELKSLHGESGA